MTLSSHMEYKILPKKIKIQAQRFSELSLEYNQEGTP